MAKELWTSHGGTLASLGLPSSSGARRLHISKTPPRSNSMTICFSKNPLRSLREFWQVTFLFWCFYYLHVYWVFCFSATALNLLMSKSFDLQIGRWRKITNRSEAFSKRLLYSFVFKGQGEIGWASYIFFCVSNLTCKCIRCDKYEHKGRGGACLFDFMPGYERCS